MLLSPRQDYIKVIMDQSVVGFHYLSSPGGRLFRSHQRRQPGGDLGRHPVAVGWRRLGSAGQGDVEEDRHHGVMFSFGHSVFSIRPTRLGRPESEFRHDLAAEKKIVWAAVTLAISEGGRYNLRVDRNIK